MKKLIIIIAGFLTVNIAISGPVDVPEAVQDSVHSYYPGDETINWIELQEGRFEAVFSYHQRHVNVFLDHDGTVYEIDEEIAWVDLPLQARQCIELNYAGCWIEKLMSVKKSSSGKSFFAEVYFGGKQHLMFFNKLGELMEYHQGPL